MRWIGLILLLLLSSYSFGLGWALQQKLAEDHIHYVLGLNPSFFKYHLSHSDEEVIDNAISLMSSIGDFCWHKGFHFQVIRIYKASIEVDPYWGEAYENCSWLLISYGYKDEALSLLKRYLKYNPDRYEPYYELGWFYYHWQKQYNNAIPWLKKAIKLPHPHIIENTLAHAYEKVGRYRDALFVWEDKLKRFPNDLVAKQNYERVKRQLESYPKEK